MESQPVTPTPYPCGSSTHEMEMSSDQCQDDCTRTYHLYIPCAANATSPEIGILPLVYAIHCFGCDASVMRKWETIAQTFNFMLVRPEGVNHSWNSKYCCGYALEKKLNDVGFLELIRDEVAERSDRVQVDKNMVYGVGWSNGGYMVSYAAHMFRSIVPISGYQYDNLEIIAGNSPRGIFQHHSLNDPFVRFGGCCTDATQKSCCCGISEASTDQCHSVDSTFDDWAKKVNQCTSTTIVFKDDERGIECRSGDGCRANSTLCVYENSMHFNRPSFSIAFPMFEEVGHFFARDACSMNGAKWEMVTKTCTCDVSSESGQSGRYCVGMVEEKSSTVMSDSIDPEVFASSTDQEDTFQLATTGWFAMSTAILLVVALILRWKKNRSGSYKKKDEWERLATKEPVEVELT